MIFARRVSQEASLTDVESQKNESVSLRYMEILRRLLPDCCAGTLIIGGEEYPFPDGLLPKMATSCPSLFSRARVAFISPETKTSENQTKK